MPTPLLDDDGTASVASMLLCSHHAFRRDLACFARALEHDHPERVPALREEWTRFRGALHGHHMMEDTTIFPDIRDKQPELAFALDELGEQHHAIDPLLERGDHLFAELSRDVSGTRALIGELAALLAKHLDAEEPVIVPHLRRAKDFPVPPADDVYAMYADGFAWSSHGIARDVLDQVFGLLPAALTALIPAASRAFEARCVAVWGSVPHSASKTSVPDR